MRVILLILACALLVAVPARAEAYRLVSGPHPGADQVQIWAPEWAAGTYPTGLDGSIDVPLPVPDGVKDLDIEISLRYGQRWSPSIKHFFTLTGSPSAVRLRAD